MLVVGVRDGGVRLVEVIDGARGPSGQRDLDLLAWLGLAWQMDLGMSEEQK